MPHVERSHLEVSRRELGTPMTLGTQFTSPDEYWRLCTKSVGHCWDIEVRNGMLCVSSTDLGFLECRCLNELIHCTSSSLVHTVRANPRGWKLTSGKSARNKANLGHRDEFLHS